MRLRTGGTRAEIPAAPAANLAVLLILLVVVSAVFSSPRGILVRLPGGSGGAALPPPDQAVLLSVLPDATLLLDGEPVAREALLARIEPKVGRNASRPVVLEVSDEVSYSQMVSLVDLLSEGDGASAFRVRRLFLPTRAEMREWTRALGRHPFDAHSGPATGGGTP